MEVRATRAIAAPPQPVFAFLEEFDRHWELLGDRLEPLRGYDGRRSHARLRGPLGIRRTLWIELATLDPPRELTGRVEVGHGRTVGTVRWVLRPEAPIVASDPARAETSRAARIPGARSAVAVAPRSVAATTVVELTARTELAGPLDRLLLLCGGRRWLRRSLVLVLARLDERLGQ